MYTKMSLVLHKDATSLKYTSQVHLYHIYITSVHRRDTHQKCTSEKSMLNP